MRFRFAALFIPCLALGGCISSGDGSILEVVLADQNDAQTAANVIGAGAPAPSDTLALAPLPPPRPPEFGGVLLASADNDTNIEELEPEEDEAATGAGAGPFQWLTSAPANTRQAALSPQPMASLDSSAKSSGPGFFAAYAYTQVNCFPESLRTALDAIAVHYKKPVEVASGYRPNAHKGSMHRHCMAADIRIEGVEPMALATYAKTVPGINGVGSYRNTDLIHVDVRQEQFAWRH